MTPEQELLHLAHQARLGIFHLDDGPTLDALTKFAQLLALRRLPVGHLATVGELSGVFEQMSES